MQGEFCSFIQNFEKQAIDVVNLEAVWCTNPRQSTSCWFSFGKRLLWWLCV